MKRLLFSLLFLVFVILPARAAEKANTVLIHPGETIYARFELKGKKIRLVSYTKEKDEGAQVIFTLGPDTKDPAKLNSLKVENRFARELKYRAEIRSLTVRLKFKLEVSPVVAGKVAFESFPKQVEQVAAFDFQLGK